VASGALPTGLTLNGTTGVLSGTPTASGVFSFVVRATNGAAPNADTPTRTITIAEPPGSLYTPILPTRLLDTRNGTGGPTSPFGAGETRDLLVTGGLVPADATAVVINMTVTSPSVGGFLTVFPAGVPKPLASNLNFGPGDTIPNLVTVGVGTAGKISIFNNAGTTAVIGDVVGYYRLASGARYTATAPTRLLDTRTPAGGPIFGAAETRGLLVTGGVVPEDATAVVLNMTVTGGSSPAFLTVFPASQSRPLASNLNFGPGQTIPNLVIVGVGTGGLAQGKVNIFNSAGTVHVLADVVGYYRNGATGGAFTAVTPVRLMDTRSAGGALGATETRPLVVRGVTPVPAAATAVVMNTTATAPTADSYLTVFPAGTAQPLASNLNFGPGLTIPNLVMVGVGTSGPGANKVSFYNNAGTVHVIADIVGYMTEDTPV
jgi:hypothetical protein